MSPLTFLLWVGVEEHGTAAPMRYQTRHLPPAVTNGDAS